MPSVAMPTSKSHPDSQKSDPEWEKWAPDDGKRVTLEEYWRDYYDHEHNYEWNHGILEAKPMPTEENGGAQAGHRADFADESHSLEARRAFVSRHV